MYSLTKDWDLWTPEEKASYINESRWTGVCSCGNDKPEFTPHKTIVTCHQCSTFWWNDRPRTASDYRKWS